MSQAHQTNRLVNSVSPYLLQHSQNPVDWWPWCVQAWEEAEQNNKLVLISIGYSACHWCHVMEQETFRDVEVGQFMNDHFVCIKVDREERPDVDDAYMDAIQLMSGQGGWPLNCIALSDGRPVWGGTYFDKQTWLNRLNRVANAWVHHPRQVFEYAEKLTNAVQDMNRPVDSAPLNSDESSMIDEPFIQQLERWSQKWDPHWGGSIGSPKFPQCPQIALLLVCQNHPLLPTTWQTTCHEHAIRTLLGMERGGIHDHVGGGFSRYSMDHRWHVPHFEKMLYDNAQLLKVFADAYFQAPHPAFCSAAHGIAQFLDEELSHPQGGFMSSLDADSSNEEGAYYVWDAQTIEAAISEEKERQSVMDVFSVGRASLWEHGKNVLMRQPKHDRDYWEDASRRQHVESALAHLKNWRDSASNGREKPSVDDKILTSWTALAVSGLVRAGRILNQESWIQRGRKAGLYLQQIAPIQDDSPTIRRSWHPNGGLVWEGYSEDYAMLIEAFLELYQATLETHWLQEARKWMATALDRFFDPSTMSFWDTSNQAESLYVRKQRESDSELPSANAIFALNLWKIGWACDMLSWRNLAHVMTDSRLSQRPEIESHATWYGVHLEISKDYAHVVVLLSDEAEATDALRDWWSKPRPRAWLDAYWPESTRPYPAWLTNEPHQRIKTKRWFVCVEGACQLPQDSLEQAWNQLNR